MAAVAAASPITVLDQRTATLIFEAKETLATANKKLPDADKAFWIGVAFLVVGVAAVTLGIAAGVFKVDFPKVLLEERVWISSLVVGGALVLIGAVVLKAGISQRKRVEEECASAKQALTEYESSLIDETQFPAPKALDINALDEPD